MPFIIATAIWGTTWIVIRDQLSLVPPGWSIAYRFFVASAAMFLYALLRREPLRLGHQGQIFALAFAIPQFVLNFFGIYAAEALIPSGLVAVIYALGIVPNAILSRLFLGRSLSARFLFGSAIALFGVACLILNQWWATPGRASTVLAGVAFTLFGLLAASTGSVMQGSRRAHALPMATMLAWAMLWGAVIAAALAWAQSGPPVFDPRPGYILGVLYLGVCASAVAFACYIAVIRRIGPAHAAYIGVITPVLAMVITTIFESYHWTVLAAGGGVLAILGLWIALSSRRA